MALPTTISGVFFGDKNINIGPFISSGGNVYVVIQITSSSVAVFKATDPTSSFSEQDSGNRPNNGTADVLCDVTQEGDTLHIITYQGVANPVRYSQFSMSSDTWVRGAVTIVTPTNDGNGARASIAVRSNGDLIAFVQSPAEKLMGTQYSRTSYCKSTDGGANWGSPVTVMFTGQKTNYLVRACGLGASDRIHFFIDVGNVNHQSLSSSDVLDTASLFTSGTTLHHTPVRSYVSGANTVVKFSIFNDGKQVRFNSGANPTPSTDTGFPDAATVGPAGSALDGTTIHYLWARNSDGHVMHDVQTDGGSFGTDVDEFTGSVSAVKCNIYTRGSNVVLAYVMNDGGTIKYNEIVLSSAGFTLAADGGSYAISGTVAATKFGRLVSAVSGSYALGGTAATLLLGKKIIADSGAYAISGSDVSFPRTYILYPDSGAYVLSGTDLLLKIERLLTADAGAYALNGLDASLLFDRLLAANSGTYLLSGTDVTFLVTHILAAESGTYLLNGTNASLIRGFILVANSGAYILSGSIANLLANRILTATGGTYALSGTDLSLFFGRVVQADPGSYALNGSDVGLLIEHLLTAEGGVYVLTGTDATLIRSGTGAFVLAADPGAYALTGTQVAILFNRNLIAESGAYILSGQIVDLLRYLILTADSGSFALSGSDSTLLFDRLLSALSGSYQLVGSDAALLRDFTMAADSGVYALDGDIAALLTNRNLNALSGAYQLAGTDVQLIYTPTGGVQFVPYVNLFRRRRRN